MGWSSVVFIPLNDPLCLVHHFTTNFRLAPVHSFFRRVPLLYRILTLLILPACGCWSVLLRLRLHRRLLGLHPLPSHCHTHTPRPTACSTLPLLSGGPWARWADCEAPKARAWVDDFLFWLLVFLLIIAWMCEWVRWSHECSWHLQLQSAPLASCTIYGIARIHPTQLLLYTIWQGCYSWTWRYCPDAHISWRTLLSLPS